MQCNETPLCLFCFAPLPLPSSSAFASRERCCSRSMMASGSERRRRKGRRILDYLNDGEEVGSTGEGPSSTVGTPSSPRSPSAAARSLLLRFRWARVSRLGRKGAAAAGCVKGKGYEEEEKLEQEQVVVEKGERMNLGASACSTATSGDGGDGGGEGTRPADLGVGLSLVFLLAKTSDEFSRMAKVRSEMETLLEEFKQQVGVRDSTASDDGALRTAALNVESAASSCLTADGNEQRVANNGRTSAEDQATTSGAEATTTRSRRCSEQPPEDVLEEEFHAELERLQVNYGCSSDTPPLFLPEELEHDAAAEPSQDISDYYHQRGGFSDDDDEDSGEEDEEDIAVPEDEDADADADDYDGAEYNGVSAVELERRLHELLHQRNQERIEELEAALRRAERKLVERESEACLWKDTARLALRQDDDDDALQ